MKRVLTLAVLLGCTWMVWGQTAPQGRPAAAKAPQAAPKTNKAGAPVVTVRFIPDSIAIGDHFTLRMEVDKDIMQQIGWPAPEPPEKGPWMLTEYIEILAEGREDTVRKDGRRVTLAKEWTLTAFDAGHYGIKGMSVLYKDKNVTDTVWAKPDSIMVQVSTFEIDTTTQTIYDIKPTMRMPLRAGEISGYILMALLLVALVVAAVWMVRKWRRDHTIFGRREAVPPHVAAIRALEALHHQKLWQNNKHKQYYTLLADIVRTYIEGRYGIQAMEMTTDELMRALKGVELSETNRSKLAGLLGVADLAKFAKYTPSAEDNEACYNDAYYFVEDTKPAEAPADPEAQKI